MSSKEFRYQSHHQVKTKLFILHFKARLKKNLSRSIWRCCNRLSMQDSKNNHLKNKILKKKLTLTKPNLRQLFQIHLAFTPLKRQPQLFYKAVIFKHNQM